MDEEPRPIAHRGSEDVSGQLEAAISAVRDEDMLHGMHELTLDNIHNLSTAPQVSSHLSSYQGSYDSELPGGSLYAAPALPPITHIGDVIPVARLTSSSTSSEAMPATRPRISIHTEDDADSGMTVSPLPNMGGRKVTPTKAASASGLTSGPSSRSSSRPGSSGGGTAAAAGSAGTASTATSKNKLPRVAMLSKPPPKKEEPLSPPRSGPSWGTRSPGAAGRGSPSPTSKGVVSRSTSTTRSAGSAAPAVPRTVSMPGSRIPRPGSSSSNLSSPTPKTGSSAAASPTKKAPPSPAPSFGSPAPKPAPASGDSGSRLYGTAAGPTSPAGRGPASPAGRAAASPAARGAPSPAGRSTGGYVAAGAAAGAAVARSASAKARPGAAAGSGPPVSPSKMDTRKQLEDIMRDLQDIKKDLGLPVDAAPPAGAAEDAGGSATDAAAAAPAEAQASAGEPAAAEMAVPATAEEAQEEGFGSGGCGDNTEPQPQEAAAAEQLAADDKAAADAAAKAAAEEAEAAAAAAAEAAAAVQEEPAAAAPAEVLPTSTAAAYIEGVASPKAVEAAEPPAAKQQCGCACTVM